MGKEIIKITARCPIRTTLELVGGKWKLLILFQLANKPLRLSELKRQIQELKSLIDSTLVERKNFGEVPPRVEYELKPIGYRIIPHITGMKNFAADYEKSQF